MSNSLSKAMLTIDRDLLGQNLAPARADSLAAEVRRLNETVRAHADRHLDFFDEPASFLSELRRQAWQRTSSDNR